VVLILGMLVVVVLMVIRLGTVEKATPRLAPVSAEHLALPVGAEIVAVGQGGAGVLVVTRDAAGAETLRAFDPSTGAQTSATPITRE